MTGATGAVAAPIVRSLAAGSEVHALAHFGTPKSAQWVRDVGATPLLFDLTTSSYADLDDDYDIVLKFAVRRTTDDNFDLELATEAEAVGLLMKHCHRAHAFFQCSTTNELVADFLIAMAVTNPDVHARKGSSMNLVPAVTPGVEAWCAT